MMEAHRQADKNFKQARNQLTFGASLAIVRQEVEETAYEEPALPRPE